MAFLLVPTVPSATISPSAPSTQYRLVLSPRSMPIVIGPGFATLTRFGLFFAMLFFFMAGLLFALRVRIHWEAYRIPPGAGLLIPSRKRGYISRPFSSDFEM